MPRGWFLKGGEWAYVARIATGETVPYTFAESEMGMTGGKRVPDRIVEQRVALEM